MTEYTAFGSEEKVRLTAKMVQSFLCVPTRNGNVCDERDAVKFIMLCRARRLNPFEGDAFLIGYETKDGPRFSLITAHQAFLKRAETHPDFDGMESGVVVKCNGEVINRMGDLTIEGDELLGGWATVYFKQRSHSMKKRLKLSTFKKNFGRWLDDPEGMIVKCAESDALRSSFPTLLGGMYLEEELPTTGGNPVPATTMPAKPTGRQSLKRPRPNGPVRASQPKEPGTSPDAAEPNVPVCWSCRAPAGGCACPPAGASWVSPAMPAAAETQREPGIDPEEMPVQGPGTCNAPTSFTDAMKREIESKELLENLFERVRTAATEKELFGIAKDMVAGQPILGEFRYQQVSDLFRDRKKILKSGKPA